MYGPQGHIQASGFYPNRILLSTLKLDQKNYHLSDMYMWEGGDEAISNGEKQGNKCLIVGAEGGVRGSGEWTKTLVRRICLL